NKVDFPVPLAPIRPALSPGLICQFASSYNALEPISNVKLFIDIISGAKVMNISASLATFALMYKLVEPFFFSMNPEQAHRKVTSGLKIGRASCRERV